VAEQGHGHQVDAEGVDHGVGEVPHEDANLSLALRGEAEHDGDLHVGVVEVPVEPLDGIDLFRMEVRLDVLTQGRAGGLHDVDEEVPVVTLVGHASLQGASSRRHPGAGASWRVGSLPRGTGVGGFVPAPPEDTGWDNGLPRPWDRHPSGREL